MTPAQAPMVPLGGPAAFKSTEVHTLRSSNADGRDEGASAKRPAGSKKLVELVQQHNPLIPHVRQRPASRGRGSTGHQRPVHHGRAGVKPAGLQAPGAKAAVRPRQEGRVARVTSVQQQAPVLQQDEESGYAEAPRCEDEIAAVRGAATTSSHRGLNKAAALFVPAPPSPLKEVAGQYKLPPRVVRVNRVAAVRDATARPANADIPWQQRDSELVARTLLFRARMGSIEIRFIYDTGSQVQMVSASLAERAGLATMPTDMQLEFADGSTMDCNRVTTRQTINIQGGSFLERFVVSKTDIAGVDMILGLGFAERSRAQLIWPKEGSTDVPFLLFPDGVKWYGEDVVGTTSPRICTINAKQTERFVKDCKGDFNLVAVSLSEILTREEALKRNPAQPVEAVLQEVLDDFKDIFREDLPLDLPSQRQDQPNSIHHIPLIEGAMPVKVRTLPMSWGQRLKLAELLTELLDKGYISPAPDNTQWSAPIFLLKKGEGNKPGPVSLNWRLITDFRALNALTKPSVYVPPSVREVLDSLVHKKVFSRSDNLSGFYQAALAEEDRIKTTFTCFTPTGEKRSYYFNVSCLGLQGAPSSYQLFMEDVIAGIPDVVCYIDDLAYASNTLAEHAVLLRKVFTRLRQNQVYLNATKCRWGLAGMDFLGMHVSHNHVRISDEKVQGLTEYPVPKTFEELRRFVGFANYVGQFIGNFSTQIVGLTDMLKQQAEKKKKFVWTATAQQEFDSVRSKLIASAGLVIPDLRGEFVVETDASGLGMGAVLYQFLRGPAEGEGRLVPVWFMSRKFNEAEVNYNTRDREALAVTWALLKCKPYLLMKKFVLYSDHESLAGFKVQPGLKNKDWRHQEFVGEFDFEQRYRQGALMVAPDALSRAFDNRVMSNTVWSEVDHILHGAALPVTVRMVRRRLGLQGAAPQDAVQQVQRKTTHVRWAASVPVTALPSSAEAASWVQRRQREVLKEWRARSQVRPQRKWRKAEWDERLQDMLLCPVPRSWVTLQRFISRVTVFKDLFPEYRKRMAETLTLWRDKRRTWDDTANCWQPAAFVWPQKAAQEFRRVCWDLAVLGGLENVAPIVRELAVASMLRVGVRVTKVIRPEVVVPPAPEFNNVHADAMQEAYAATLLEVNGAAVGVEPERTWRDDVREAYKTDELYGPLMTLCGRAVDTLNVQEKTRIRCYKVLDDMLYFAPQGAASTRLCVPVSPNNVLRLVMLYDSHESGVHGGVEKTYARLAARYYWPNMEADVRRYILSCRSCRLNKARTRAEVGALGGLPIPPSRWHTVGMDWITDLPVTRAGHDAVLVVEDAVTKYAYFLAAKKRDNAQAAARRAFAAVFCVHGAPDTIVSDRDKLFTSTFYGALMALMHVKQAMGTSHYHDFNGAVECLNKTVEVMLRHLLSEFPDNDFDELLPMVQWAYNTSVHSTTHMTPYFALYGVPPREPMNFVAAPGEVVPPAVAAFAEMQAGVLALTRDALYKAQATMLEYENRRRREPQLRVNDHVYLSTTNLGPTHFPTTVAKLRQRFVGPFRIAEKRSGYKYLLQLPKALSGVYPVFHASLLWKALPTPVDMQARLGAGVEFPPEVEPEPVEGTALLTHDDQGVPVYVIEKVLHRRKAGRGFQYLVKWQGYDDPIEDTWLSRSAAVTTAAARAFDQFDALEDALEAASRGDASTIAAPAQQAPTVASVVPEVSAQQAVLVQAATAQGGRAQRVRKIPSRDIQETTRRSSTAKGKQRLSAATGADGEL